MAGLNGQDRTSNREVFWVGDVGCCSKTASVFSTKIETSGYREYSLCADTNSFKDSRETDE